MGAQWAGQEASKFADTPQNLSRHLEYIYFFIRLFVFVTPEGFTIMVGNEELEKARAYFTDSFNIPSEGCSVNFA